MNLKRRFHHYNNKSLTKNLKTQTFDKDVSVVVIVGTNVDTRDKQAIKCQLNSGDVVEGEVSAPNGTGGFISSVNDHLETYYYNQKRIQNLIILMVHLEALRLQLT